MMQGMCDCMRQMNETRMPHNTATQSVKQARRLRYIPCRSRSQEHWRTYYRKLFQRMRIGQSAVRRGA